MNSRREKVTKLVEEFKEMKFEELEKRLLRNALRIDRYLKTINDLKNNFDLTSDSEESEEYRKNFNAFYRLRKDKKTWQNKYYEIFQKYRNQKNVEFDDLLEEIYNIDNTVEPSFTSKMLATINPDKPVWDKYVREKLNLHDNKNYQIDKVKEDYAKIENRMKELLNNKNIAKSIKSFKEKYDLNELSDMKVLDLILWQIRDEKEE